MPINLKAHRGLQAIPNHIGYMRTQEEEIRELRSKLAAANKGAERNAHINRSLAKQVNELREQLTTEKELRKKAERTIAGIEKNIGSCGACAEGLFCGSYSIPHIPECVYSQVDGLREKLAEAVRERNDWKACAECYKQSRDEATAREKELRQKLAEAEKTMSIMHKFSADIYGATCIHHTDEERKKFSCPVCLRAKLADCEHHLAARTAPTLEQSDADFGRRWREDSSLEKWFPITAEELSLLRAENAAFREALMPFAALADAYNELARTSLDGEIIDGMNGVKITVGHLRSAKAAVEKGEGK